MKTMSQCWIIILVMLSPGCYSATTVSVSGPEFGFGSFINSIPSFPYDAPASRQERVVDAFPKLEIGMDKESVRELLGDPDAEFLNYADDHEEVFLGSSWGFYLHRHGPELVDEEHDRTLFVDFDESGRAHRANLSEPHSVMEIYDPKQRYPGIAGNRMTIHVLPAIALGSIVLISCALAVAGAITRFRSNHHWPVLCEIIGPSIILLSLVLELGQPLLFTLTMSPLYDWRLPRFLGGIGLAVFCIGYWLAARRSSKSTMATAEH